MKGRLLVAAIIMAIFCISCENKHEEIRKEMNRIAQNLEEDS